MKKKLHLQIAIAISLSAIMIAIVSSWLVYSYSYKKVLQEERTRTTQLLNTIKETAAIAVYLNENELAKEVVQGLVRNDIVSQASILLNNGSTVVAGNPSLKVYNSIKKQVFSPFNSNEKIGRIIIIQNQTLIEEKAKSVGLVNAFALFMQTLVVTLVSVILIFKMLTKPIKHIAQKLHHLTPGSDERISIIEIHKDNELGELIGDTNNLLNSVQINLLKERDLRHKIESLEAHYRQIFESASAGIAFLNAELSIISRNVAFQQIMERSNVSGHLNGNITSIFHDKNTIKNILLDISKQKGSISADLKIERNVHDEEIWVHAVFSSVERKQNNTEALIEIILHDITERYIRERESEHISNFDHLTQILNRGGMEKELKKNLSFGYDSIKKNSVLYMLDLDGFKPINDIHGHDAGDETLIEIAARLKILTRKDDLVCRWGGDEFIILLNSYVDLEISFDFAHKIYSSISKPLILSYEKEVILGVSIGMSIIELDNDFNFEINQKIKYADMAMYDVKKNGKNGVCYYNPLTKEYTSRFF